MRRIRAALAVEVDFGLPASSGGVSDSGSSLRRKLLRLAAVISVPSAVKCSSLNIPRPARLAHDFFEEPLGDLIPEQPPSVLGEQGPFEAWLQQAHIQEPAV